MSFLGMGTLEILVVLVIAFIFLGPERMVDAARTIGRFVREARRMASELPGLDMNEDDGRSPAPPAARRGGRRAMQMASSNGHSPSSDSDQGTAADEDAPVPHQRAVPSRVQAKTDAKPGQEQS